jgi:hypothetical protein
MRYRDANKLNPGDEVVAKATGEVRLVCGVSLDGGSAKYPYWLWLWTTDYRCNGMVLYIHNEVI